jgi:hypothetical protein
VIPHGIVMMFLAFGQYTALFFAWWAILFTGRYPRGLFNFVVAVQAWSIRVNAYAAFLVTDAYPPFEFDRPVNTGLAVGMIFLGSALLVAFFVVVPAIALAAAMSGSGGGLVY